MQTLTSYVTSASDGGWAYTVGKEILLKSIIQMSVMWVIKKLTTLRDRSMWHEFKKYGGGNAIVQTYFNLS